MQGFLRGWIAFRIFRRVLPCPVLLFFVVYLAGLLACLDNWLMPVVGSLRARWMPDGFLLMKKQIRPKLSALGWPCTPLWAVPLLFP